MPCFSRLRTSKAGTHSGFEADPRSSHPGSAIQDNADGYPLLAGLEGLVGSTSATVDALRQP